MTCPAPDAPFLLVPTLARVHYIKVLPEPSGHHQAVPPSLENAGVQRVSPLTMDGVRFGGGGGGGGDNCGEDGGASQPQTVYEAKRSLPEDDVQRCDISLTSAIADSPPQRAPDSVRPSDIRPVGRIRQC